MDSDVDKVKARVNIVDVVGQYVTLRRAGRNYSGRCPFHKERTPSFHVSPERGTFKCFGCGEGGDVFTFLEKIDGIDFKTALKQLAEKAGIKLSQTPTGPRPEEKKKEERLREVCAAATQFFEAELVRHAAVADYIRNRGVTDDTAGAWRLGYAPAAWDALSLHLQKIGFSQDDIVLAGFAIKSDKRPGQLFDRFRGRIMFPIFDIAGEPIAMSGRFFERVPGARDDGQEPAKYINSPETPIFKKSRTLYGLHVARAFIRKADCILLVEGQFDLLMAHQSGLPFAVALSGTALTEEHLSLLARLSKRLVLALDADPAGVRAGLKSAYLAIVAGFEVKVPTFPAGADPADVARENPELLKAAVRTSKTAVDFFMDSLRPIAKDERAYATLIQTQVLPLLAAMQSRVDQEHFANAVARRLGVSHSAVMVEVAKRPRPAADASPEAHQTGAQLSLSPLQKKAGMLLARFGAESEVAEKLRGILGAERLRELWEPLAPHAEELRFRFDQEVGEGATEESIAQEVVGDIARQAERDRFKMKFV